MYCTLIFPIIYEVTKYLQNNLIDRYIRVDTWLILIYMEATFIIECNICPLKCLKTTFVEQIVELSTDINQCFQWCPNPEKFLIWCSITVNVVTWCNIRKSQRVRCNGVFLTMKTTTPMILCCLWSKTCLCKLCSFVSLINHHFIFQIFCLFLWKKFLTCPTPWRIVWFKIMYTRL